MDDTGGLGDNPYVSRRQCKVAFLLRRASDTARFECQILGLWPFVQDLTLNLARLPIA